MVLADVASEDGHAAHADRNGEEGLAHGRIHGIAEGCQLLGQRGAGEHLAEIRHQIETQTLGRARQRDRAHAQGNEHHEQGHHHDLRHALHALLHAGARDAHAHAHDDEHVHGKLHRVGEQAVEDIGNLGTFQPHELARGAFHHEGEHPAAHGGVEHHEQVVAGKRQPLERMPFRARRLKDIVAARDGALACTAGGELHDEGRKREDGQEHQVHDHKRRAAVLARDIGESPHVAQADGAARAHQDEPKAGSELLAFHSSSKPRAVARVTQKRPA